MTKFNRPSKGKNKTVNHEGDVGYKMDSKLELYSTVCVANLEPRFYEKAGTTINRIRELVNSTDPEFVAKLGSFARNKMYLRSVPMVLTAELAKIHNGDDLVRKMCSHTIKRADEINELLSYYSYINKDNHLKSKSGQIKSLCKLSKQLQKGVADSFHRFDEYQFGKYNRKTNVRFRDALFLTHPKPSSEKEKALFNKIASDTLDIPYTWEVEFSKLGQQTFSKTEDKELAFRTKWEELVDSKKLGYMATLRNLRNMLEYNIDTGHTVKVAQLLSSPDMVRKSKQLPFRFLSAYRTLTGQVPFSDWRLTSTLKALKHPHIPMLLNSLEDAVKVSTENLKGFGYETSVLVACDVSGSMQQTISKNSVVSLYDVGLLLGMLLQNKCKNVITGIFGNDWLVYPLPQASILQNVDKLHSIEGKVGYSTNGYKVLEWLNLHNVDVEKVMIFTDCQMWNSSWGGGTGTFGKQWSTYKKSHPNSKLYLFNLGGYKTTPIQVNDNDVFLISGWSDKIFETLDAIEKGSSAVKEIEKISL